MLINKKKTIASDGTPLPKTAQQTIPMRALYKNGVIEANDGSFSKVYKLNNINFNSLSKVDQETVFNKYKEFLNSFGADTTIQINMYNKNTDKEQLYNSIKCDMALDNYNEYREELNTILYSKMSEGNNNIINEKSIVVSIKPKTIEEAMNKFVLIDSEIDRGMKDISQNQDSKTVPLSSEERVKQLHDMFNIGKEDQLHTPIDFVANEKAGLTVKDLISPAGFQFKMNHLRIGDKFAQTLFLKSLPSTLSTDFMSDLSILPFNYIASFYIKPIAPDTAIKKTSSKLTSIRADVVKAQKNASRNGYSPELISPNLKFAKEQMEYLQSDLRTGQQKLFETCVTFMVYADSQKELDNNVKSLITMGNKYTLTLEPLFFQQEAGLKTVLPLGYKEVLTSIEIPSEAVSLFIPFTTKELMQKGGMYYGINAISKNLLLFNRLASKNQNGLILGQPGSGKSFAAKREMINVFLTTNDDIYVIDPESEYASIAKIFGGSVIRLEAGSRIYINPFDMDIQYADDENSKGTDPVTLKSDYICMLCETAMGGRYEISNIQKSIIDRVVIKLYKPYMRHMRELNDKNITCDTEASPTMEDFYELLMTQPEPEAQDIALSLEIYCRGSFDTFAHKTNVDVSNRFTVYDIKDIGQGMKEMGLQVCLNHIWNKIISNQKISKRTWFYIDEFHVLTKTRSSAAFLQQIWKRARKWGGIPTAITQNVDDLLNSEESRAIISNCDFIMMLSQSPIDRAALAEMYKISENQLSYITNSPAGQGLIYNGEFIVPFVDKFPEDTKLYKAMTSKADERIIA